MNSTQSTKSPASPAIAAPENPFVRFTASGIHGTGGFARTTITAGTRIIEYVGERIDKAEAERRCEAENHYIFHLDETWDLDGDISWNPAKFINHSCAPNCEAELEEDEGRIWILARRDIAADEELTFNYGYDLADYRDHTCRCGTKDCIGYIVAEEFFDQVRGQQKLPA